MDRRCARGTCGPQRANQEALIPAFLEAKLKKEYGNNPSVIYGTMNKLGFMHGNKETAKGAEAEKKHEAKMGALTRTARTRGKNG